MVNRMKSLAVAAGVVSMLGVSSSSWAQYTWNMTTATPNNPSAIANITAGAIAQGNNNGTTTLLVSGSVSSGYTTASGLTASGTFNAGAAAFTGALNPATSTYFTLTLTPAAGFAVNLTGIDFGSRSTSTGAQLISVLTSVDNFTVAAGSAPIANNSTWVAINPAITPVLGAVDAPLVIRIYGSAGAGAPTAGTANWRIDDLTVNATAVSAAIPEPTTLVFLSIGVIGFVARRRKK
jgi:hypothetical protein